MREDHDELLMENNPMGGRPMGLGTLVFKGQNTVDINAIGEILTVRYHLGYCSCGRRIVVGQERAKALAQALHKRGLLPVQRREPLRVRLGRRLMRGNPT